MRFNSFAGAAIFAIVFVAGAAVILWWCIFLARSARSLRRVGNTGRAELLNMIVRRALLWTAGTLLFTTVFWLAVCHDLNRYPVGPLYP